MTFARFWILHFFWLLPLVILLLLFHYRQRTRAMERFAESQLLTRLAGEVRQGRIFLKGFFLVSSLALVLFALAGPRWGSHYQEVSQKGVDIMILVDVSPSMLVEDTEPNRLERAKREIIDFLKVIQGDRVGLVAFSGAAFVQCPLTLDHAALRMFLNILEPDLIPIPGTDLGAAIETGLSSFDFTSETDKVILLITDGEDNEQRALNAAAKAAQKGVKIFTFGIGDSTTSGGPIPETREKGQFKKDHDGKLVMSRLDVEGLKAIADSTGGNYLLSIAGSQDMDILYFDGIRTRTTAETIKDGKIKVYEERFTFFLLAAFLFLIMEGLINRTSTNGRPSKGRFFQYKKPIVRNFIFMVFCLFITAQAMASEDAEVLYRKGLFLKAEKAYARSDMDNPKDLKHRYNRGCAAYKGFNFQCALDAFSSVLNRTDDKVMRFKCAYNLGNTAFKLLNFQSAAEIYKEAIRYNPESANARYNLEVALRALEKLKKDENPPDQPEEKDSPKDGDEKDSSGTEKKPDNSNEPSEKEEDKGGQSESRENRNLPPESSSNKNNQSESEELPDNPDGPLSENTPAPPPDQTERNNQDKQEKQPEQEQNIPDVRMGEQKEMEENPQEDLSGDLKPRMPMPHQEAEKPGDYKKNTLDRKKAEAMLNNLKEDRSQYVRSQIPKDKRHGVLSGKDW